jgi:succinyl-CoA synthetase beta subunit
MVVRIVGTNAELAAEILSGIEGIETATSLDDAVERAVAASRAQLAGT